MTFFNKNILKITIVFLLVTSLYACNIFKKNIDDKKYGKEKDLTKILKKTNEKSLKYETLVLNFSGEYIENGKKNPLKGIIKINHNNFIYITLRPFLGIEIAKILMTTDSVKFVDKINKQYFISDYEYINKKFGVEASLSLIEKLFTGKYFLYPENTEIKNYKFLKSDTSYVLKKQDKIFHDLIFDKNFILKKNNFSSSDNLYSSKIKYSDFYLTEKKYFPQTLSVSLAKKNKKINVLLKYKTIKVNEKISLKFKIPGTYKKIKVE